MPGLSTQLHEEQQAVDRAYARLDALRSQTRTRLDTVRAAGSHGSPTQRTERDSFATMYEDRLTQLRAMEDRLVFGRLDDVKGERRYIGRIGLSSENHEPILTDWRAEAARPFYEATPSNHGDIVMRRHITLNFRDVIGIEDEVLDVHSEQVDKASKAGTLTGEGALLASLSSRRTGKMTDIVATIQAEQDRIIRSDLNRALVVQGGPGTGKTAVALHRAAYLLYTHQRKLERSGVLVIGPSTTFLRYIDQVLPSLGETGVVSRTIADLIPGIKATATDTPLAAKLKGDRRMAQVVANAIALRERVPQDLPTVHVNDFAVRMLDTDVRAAIDQAKRTRQPHNKARETFVRTMLMALRDRYAEQLDYTPSDDELNEALTNLRLNDKVRVALNLAWLPMNGTWLIDNLWSHPLRLRALAPWLDDDGIAALTRPKGAPMTQSDVPLLDEAMELLGPDPKIAAQIAAKNTKRAQEEQFAQDTLNSVRLLADAGRPDERRGRRVHRTACRGRPRVDIRACGRRRGSGTDRDGLAHADPPVPVALVHHRRRRGSDICARRHAPLGPHDEPAVRRAAVGSQRADHQLPQSAGGFGPGLGLRAEGRTVYLDGQRRAHDTGRRAQDHRRRRIRHDRDRGIACRAASQAVRGCGRNRSRGGHRPLPHARSAPIHYLFNASGYAGTARDEPAVRAARVGRADQRRFHGVGQGT